MNYYTPEGSLEVDEFYGELRWLVAGATGVPADEVEYHYDIPTMGQDFSAPCANNPDKLGFIAMDFDTFRDCVSDYAIDHETAYSLEQSYRGF